MAIEWQRPAPTKGPLCLAALWDQERFLEMTGYTLLFVGAILFLALVVYWLDRWRKRPVEPGTSAGDQLSHFRELYERGQLSPEEFARIRGLLGERLRHEMKVPTPTVEIQLDEPPVSSPAADAIQARDTMQGPHSPTPPPPPPRDGSPS